MSLKCSPIIEKIRARADAADPKAERPTFVYQLNITVGGKQVQQYTLDLKQMKAYDGPSTATPDVTVTVDDETFLLLATGKTTKDEAKAAGNLKVEGSKEGIDLIGEVVKKFKEDK